MMSSQTSTPALDKVRVDKWLWAARFFKTRSLAKQAIDGGKVRINGQRVKPSRDIETGTTLIVRQGYDEKEVTVLALSDKRGSATIASGLYEETEQSKKRREKLAEERKTAATFVTRPDSKPNTRQRRHIHRFKREILSDKE